MNRRLSDREKRLLWILSSLLAASIALIGGRIFFVEAAGVQRRIEDEKAFFEATPVVSEEQLIHLRRSTAEAATGKGSPASDIQESMLLDLGEELRSIVKGLRISIHSYSRDEVKARLHFSGEADSRQLVSLLIEIDTTLSSVTLAGLSLSRPPEGAGFRFELLLEQTPISRIPYPLTSAVGAQIRAFLGYVPLEEPTVILGRTQIRETVLIHRSELPETLPLEFVGEAVVSGKEKLFLKDRTTGRLIILTAGDGQGDVSGYRLHQNGADEIEIEYKERIYAVPRD